MTESLEQIAERLAGRMFETSGPDFLRHNACMILAALREVEKRTLVEQHCPKCLAYFQSHRCDRGRSEVERLREAVGYLLEEHGGSVNIRHIKEAPGYTTVVYCPWCGDEEPCRVGRRVSEILEEPKP